MLPLTWVAIDSLIQNNRKIWIDSPLLMTELGQVSGLKLLDKSNFNALKNVVSWLWII